MLPQPYHSHAVYFPAFDWLRIVLAATVMLGHDQIFTAWHHSGNFAVQVFFALSGWLIGGILTKTSVEELPQFYFNRALRIWVPYFLACLFLISASQVKGELMTVKWLEIVFYKLTFVYNLFGTVQLADYVGAMPLQGTGNGFWSVNVEEQFYLIAPLLIVVAKRFGGAAVALWILIAFLALVTDYYASISLGVLSAIVVSQFGPFHRSQVGTSLLALVLVITTLGLVYGASYSVFAPLASVVIVLLLARPGEKQAVGAFLGGISYQLYLNHWIGSIFASAVFKPFGMKHSMLRDFVSIATSLVLAATLYWLIDRKLLANRTNWYTESRGRFLMYAGYATVTIGLIGGALYNMLSVR